MNKKRLSQNFLTDDNVKKNMLKYINIIKTDILLEIGSGEGSISKDIYKLSKMAFLVEIDTDLITHLKKNITISENVKIYNEDILKFNLKDITRKYKNIRIIGNIPYKITSKILNFIDIFSDSIKDAHLIIQKEMGEKLLKHTDSSIALILNYKFKITKLFDIKPNSFKPSPKVTSSLIKLEPKSNEKYLINYDILKKIIKISFEHKRQKIKKTINNIDKFKKYINIEKRPEDVTLNNFIRLSNFLFITKS
ncbi:MAG TPA: 16S rRNA (adenine(1518)-N(6)/adenine(1519)-N(6))-dimethyltransferase RsmA [Candidatus Azoamicus sp. MARI]